MSGWDIPGVLYDLESAGPATKLFVINDIFEIEEVTEKSEFGMDQNYPNLFNSTTMIFYTLA